MRKRALSRTNDAMTASRIGRLDTPHPPSTDDLTTLLYELLDAHDDTARLAAGLTFEPLWAAHLDYLRGLQRVARAVLARTAIESLA